MHTNNPHKTPEELLAEMRALSLSTSVREEMHHALSAYADFHPVMAPAPDGTLAAMRRTLRAFSGRGYTRPVGVLLFVAALTGGTSYAAESAIPGMTLYPVKVEVNERVFGLLHLSEAAKAKWHAELSVRRITEAERLATTRTLDAETEAALRADIATNIADVVSRAHTLDERGESHAADAIRTQVEVSLRTHADILVDIEAQSQTAREEQEKNQKKNGAEQDDMRDTRPLRTFITSLHAQSETVANAQKEARRSDDSDDSPAKTSDESNDEDESSNRDEDTGKKEKPNDEDEKEPEDAEETSEPRDERPVEIRLGL